MNGTQSFHAVLSRPLLPTCINVVVMACTFDSPCLTSLVNGAQPSFGFKPSNTGYFGIQASFTHGTLVNTEGYGQELTL
jgi:hypothetical protein